MNITVKALRAKNYKVRVSHLRTHINDINKKKIKNYYHKRQFEDKNLIYPKGGKTLVEVTTPDGKQLIEQVICSINDTYQKSVGLSIALGRLVKNNNIII